MRGENETKLTQTGAVMGTPAYMAPEQAMGHRDADARTDVHAVGVMLYEMLAGKTPYYGDNYHQVLHAIIVGKPVPLEQLRPGLPSRFYAAVTRAMSADPSARFANAAAFRAALQGELPRVDDANEQPAFALPKHLVVTDLPRPANPSLATDDTAPPFPLDPRARASAPTPAGLVPQHVQAIDLDRPALELDRPPVVEQPPPPSPSRAPKTIGVVLLAAVIATGAFLGWRTWQSPRDSVIELAHVPLGARLLLDGTHIEGTRLQLPISAEAHRLEIELPHRQPRIVTFDALRSRTIDLAAP
jgi:serine/threonine-protein kinase